MITEGWAFVGKKATACYFRLVSVAGCGKYRSLCGRKVWVDELSTVMPVLYCRYCLHHLELGSVASVEAFAETAEPLPPGQVNAVRWPVLHLGSPPAQRDDYDLVLDGLVEQPSRLILSDLTPTATLTADMHCIMRWTVRDLTWGGVLMSALIEETKPQADYAMIHAENDYTTNLRLSDLAQGILATTVNGEPIAPEHGGPLRLVIPHLYAWKSAKWVRRIEFIAEDAPGTWESQGLHNRGDVWAEERFAEKVP